jgi:hypothetical protein
MSKDLLREAIADAKAVKETAFANAKMALEEALAPHIQSMISAKLSEEMDNEDDKKEESVHAEGEEYGTDDMVKVKDLKEEEEEDDKMKKEAEEANDKDDENLTNEMKDEEEMDEELDLESIIRELEEELASSQIGTGDNKEPADDASSASTEDPGHGDHTKHETPKMMEEEGEEMADMQNNGHGKKELNIQDIIDALRELTEEADEDEEEEKVAHEYATKMESLEYDLKEAYDVITFLRTQINEVNLLNAKLLYSNKLFKKYNLNESQKAKVIDNFDRAKSVREVKLVFTTLAEAFHGNKSKPLTIKESFVSNPIPSTKPSEKTEIISESDLIAERFKKLAGLK